ncbi:MAG: Histidinol-phosphatase, partial [uncultured Thermomicrobiales bacterium]
VHPTGRLPHPQPLVRWAGRDRGRGRGGAPGRAAPDRHLQPRPRPLRHALCPAARPARRLPDGGAAGARGLPGAGRSPAGARTRRHARPGRVQPRSGEHPAPRLLHRLGPLSRGGRRGTRLAAGRDRGTLRRAPARTLRGRRPAPRRGLLWPGRRAGRVSGRRDRRAPRPRREALERRRPLLQRGRALVSGHGRRCAARAR